MFDYLKTCCELAEGSLNGKYGWFWDIGTIMLIIVLFNFGLKQLLCFLQRYFKEHNQLGKESFVTSLYLPYSYYVWFFAGVEMLDFTTLQIFSKSFLPQKEMILEIGVIAALAWFLLRWKNAVISLFVKQYSSNKALYGATRIDVINKIATVLIFLIAGLLLLEVTGSNLNTLIAFGGISGLAVAFASQEVIASFFGGLMIYITQPFAIGDWILLPEKDIEGHVEEIGWYTTKVRTFEKSPIYIPNSIFSKIVVINPSRMSHRRFKETIGIRYNDVRALREILAGFKAIFRNNPNIDQTMSNTVYFAAFGPSSLDIVLSAYSRETTSDGFALIKEEILFSVIDVLNQNGAELAFPTTCLEIPSAIKVSPHSAVPQTS